jgi:hypothetical protein
MAAKSYAWAQILPEAVPIGGDAEVATPGFLDPPSYKTDETQVVHGGNVLTPEQFTAAWDADFSHVHITNNTAEDWPPGDTIYVTVAGIPFDASNVQDSFTALETRVTNSEAAIAALDTRVAALEVGAGTALHSPEKQPAPRVRGKRKEEPEPKLEKTEEDDKAEEPWDPSDISEGGEDEEHSRNKGKKRR